MSGAVPDPRILERELLAMARIKFKPVCSACNKIIYDVIDCEYVKQSTSEVIYTMDFDIIPAVCPNCGKPFEGIEMPVKLPYDNTFEIGWRDDD